jgi:iron(III) transport system ATP-binding protein
VAAVDDVSFQVHSGEFVVLLGPSGCGKTSLLRCIAGLEQPDSGTIRLGDRLIFDGEGVNVPPEGRELSMVFQTYALWPHMTAFGNVAYPLKTQRVKKAEIRERVEAVLDLVGVGAQRDKHPHQMSGGQQQRVALARALVAGSDLILFDEPLSNIDAKVREQLRFDILEMQRRLGFTAVWVTHDQNEAMQLAHRIAVLDSGKIAQLAPPWTVYNEPASRTVARFIGRTNEVEGRVVDDHDGLRIATVHGEVRAHQRASYPAGADVIVSWRPENASLSRYDHAAPTADLVSSSDANEGSPASSAGLYLRGEITARTYVGTHTEYHVLADGKSYLAQDHARSAIGEGDDVHLFIPQDALSVFEADKDSNGPER